jgi:hypothetical protein
MKTFFCILLALSAVSAGQGKQTFTGTISDDTCARNGHAAMRMGPTDAECTRLCVMLHGSSYVLTDGKNIYILSDQQTPGKFAAMKVTVVGTLDPKTKTIKVQSITAAK